MDTNFAHRWNGGEEPRYSDFEERFGRLIPNELMDAKWITGVEQRDTVQRWSNNAAAGADSWKRCEWKQFTDAMYDQVADYLNNIEEVACGLSYKELIETPIWPEDIRITPVSGEHQERGGITRTQRRAHHHACSHTLLRVVEHKIQRSDDVG